MNFMAGIAVGFAAAVIVVHALTGGCLTDSTKVYVVKHSACVTERAFVPAGYAPIGVAK